MTLGSLFDGSGGFPLAGVLSGIRPVWAADVCRALEVKNARDAVARLDDDEKNTVVLTDGNRGNPNVTVVSEPGLYALVLSSRKPEAKEFKRWITHDVIPSIRKSGGYIAGQEDMSDADLMAKLLRQNGVEIGEKKLFKLLRVNGYLCSKGELHNCPTQRAMDMGLFEIKETAITTSDGSVILRRTPKVTGKGQVYFINKFKGGWA